MGETMDIKQALVKIADGNDLTLAEMQAIICLLYTSDAADECVNV